MNNTVLVADDEPDIGEFIKRILERRGFSVDVALDGTQTKELLGRKEFDVVFLDCSMPGIRGFDLVHLARESNKNAKIVVFSGHVEIDERVAVELGADAYMQKPLDPEKIEQIVGDSP